MYSTKSRPLLRGLATATVFATALAAMPIAAAAAPPVLNLTALAFNPSSVDVTQDYAVATVDFSATNSDSAARVLRTRVTLRQFVDGNPIGPEQTLRNSTDPDGTGEGRNSGGDAHAAQFSAEFLVPRGGSSATAIWRVTQVVLSDNLGHERTIGSSGLAAFQRDLNVTQPVDTQAPQIVYASLPYGQSTVVYAQSSGTVLRYDLLISDDAAGFWKGKVTLKGPNHAKVTATFDAHEVDNWFLLCGESEVYDLTLTYLDCTVSVPMPVGFASGKWELDSVSLTDRAGNTARYDDVTADPIRVTRNEVVSADGFAVDPAQFDNWRQSATLNLQFTPHGAQGGIANVDAEGSCFAHGVPTIGTDGVATLPFTVGLSSTCRIDSVLIEDGAGNLAVYGERYSAPALPNLVATRIPDRTPPVVTGASLPRTSMPASEAANAWGIGLDVTIEITPLAPVSGFSVTMYDQNGHSVGGMYGGIHESEDGILHLSSTVPAVPGVYTVGFTVTDAAGNSVGYNYPNFPTPPWGPLTFTVTEG